MGQAWIDDKHPHRVLDGNWPLTERREFENSVFLVDVFPIAPKLLNGHIHSVDLGMLVSTCRGDPALSMESEYGPGATPLPRCSNEFRIESRSANLENPDAEKPRQGRSLTQSLPLHRRPHPSLPPPVHLRCARPQVAFRDRVAPALGPRQTEDLLLDIGGEVEQVHDLGDASAGDVTEAGEFGLVDDGFVAEEPISTRTRTSKSMADSSGRGTTTRSRRGRRPQRRTCRLAPTARKDEPPTPACLARTDQGTCRPAPTGYRCA